jgi:hypothetical protein
MAGIKLDKLCILYPLMIGTKQLDVFYSEAYDITLKDQIIQIIDKKTLDKAFTSTFNVKFFLASELTF